MTKPPTSASINPFIGIRLSLLALLLFIELMAISLSFDAYLPQLVDANEWFSLLAYAGQFAKVIVVVIAALALATWVRIPAHLNTLKAIAQAYRFYYFIILQLLAFIIFYACSAAIFDRHDTSNPVILSWFFALLGVSGFWLLSVAPRHYWQQLIMQEKTALAFSLLLGLLAWWLAKSSQILWGPLSDLTFYTSTLFLNLIYPEIFVDAELKILGTANFLVNIAPSCSGYEGIGLVIIFTAFYLSIFRKEFRFPNALLLFPIGIFTIWLFNALRIAVLIAIGSSFSEDLALGGFHSQAGWIAFIVVIFSLLMAAHKLAFFSLQAPSASTPTPATSAQKRSANLASALLMPFIVLLASTIVVSALSVDFDWLYPIKVIAVAIALLSGWKIYALRNVKLRFEPVLAGILVFILWVILIPNAPEQNSLFQAALFSAPAGISTGWLIFRFIGAVITVPLAEELLFRGYLLARLGKQKISLNTPITFSWPGLLISSLLFGLLHNNLIAGALAGLVYGLVRYRSKSILDAVIAHAVTNLLLSILVLATGNWSLW